MKQIRTDQLLKAISVNDSPEAWHELINRHLAQWTHITEGMLNNPSEADDAVQIALLHIRKNADRFIPPASHPEKAAMAWLYRIVTNSALQILRKRRRSAAKNIELASHKIADSTQDPAQEIERKETLELIHKFKATLHERHQVVLSLHFSGNLDYQETAEVLECSYANARVKVHRALSALRKALKGAGVSCTLLSLNQFLQTAEQRKVHVQDFHLNLDSPQLSNYNAAGIEASLPSSAVIGVPLKIALSATAVLALSTAIIIPTIHFQPEETASTVSSIASPQQEKILFAKKWLNAYLKGDADALLANIEYPFYGNGQLIIRQEKQFRKHIEDMKIARDRSLEFSRSTGLDNHKLLNTAEINYLKSFIHENNPSLTYNLPAQTEFIGATFEYAPSNPKVIHNGQESIAAVSITPSNRDYGYIAFICINPSTNLINGIGVYSANFTQIQNTTIWSDTP